MHKEFKNIEFMQKNPPNVPKTPQEIMPRLILWHRDDYVKANGESSIVIILHLQGKKIKINTGISVKKRDWDSEKNIIKTTHPKAYDYNLIISNCMGRINSIFVRYRLQFNDLTPSLLRKEYDNPAEYIDFFKFMELAIKERKGELSETSMLQHNSMLSKLREFKTGLKFTEIDEEFLKRFDRFMINTLKNKINTRHNTFKVLKTYLNIAVRKGILKKNPLQKLPVKRIRTDRVYLDGKELQLLIDLYLKQFLLPGHQQSLRHFLFSCFTGLRISDLRNLNMEDIIGDMIILVPQKTRNVNEKTVKIPLTDPAKLLIKDESPDRLKGNVFNLLADQTINKHLKDIVKVCSIPKKVSFHASRHTFATIFLRETKNLGALKKLLGHSLISETMIYAHVLTEDIVEEMQVFNKFIQTE